MTTQKPVVYYIDDEPHNLTIFEASLNDQWEIKIFDSPVSALSQLKADQPAIIVSDQRMPNMNGVTFLTLAKDILPQSIRIIVTGYSDEDLVVEAVRKAGIYDYIKKPWDTADLEAAIQRAVNHWQTEQKNLKLVEELTRSQEELKALNQDLQHSKTQVELGMLREKERRLELESWVPPMIISAIAEGLKFPIRANLVGISFDIIGSSEIHNIYMDGRPIRSKIIQSFTECVLRQGGWRESHSGDSAYGHFGAVGELSSPADNALSAAREFRVALRSIGIACGKAIEVGISLHSCDNSVIELHQTQINTSRGVIVQKSFDTSSPEIDVLHRIEKLVHGLPGTNIIMTESFKNRLTTPMDICYDYGIHQVRGYKDPLRLFILPSEAMKKNLSTPKEAA